MHLAPSSSSSSSSSPSTQQQAVSASDAACSAAASGTDSDAFVTADEGGWDESGSEERGDGAGRVGGESSKAVKRGLEAQAVSERGAKRVRG